MIKLIASDIDGTLVPDGSDRMNPEIFSVIKKLKEYGVYFAAASGRPWKSIARLFEPIRDQIFYIAENGAYVGARGRELFVTPMKTEDVYEIVRQVRELKDCDIMVSGRDVVYLESKNPVLLHYLIDGYHNDVIQTEDITTYQDENGQVPEFIKISIYHQGYDAIHAAGDTMIPLWSKKLKVVTAGREWLDMMQPEVNKGAALQELQESLFISREETMVFGDNLNDIEMIRQAKYSYAIGNAREEVKQAAHFVADTNVNDGVLQVLKELLDSFILQEGKEEKENGRL